MIKWIKKKWTDYRYSLKERVGYSYKNYIIAMEGQKTLMVYRDKVLVKVDLETLFDYAAQDKKKLHELETFELEELLEYYEGLQEFEKCISIKRIIDERKG